jgi:hypothetical protein
MAGLQVLGEVPVWKSGLNEFWREARLNFNSEFVS